MRGRARRWVQARASSAQESYLRSQALSVLQVDARHCAGERRAKVRFVSVRIESVRYYRKWGSEVGELLCAEDPGDEPRRKQWVS